MVHGDAVSFMIAVEADVREGGSVRGHETSVLLGSDRITARASAEAATDVTR
jgi:hypothetical protein